MGMIFSAMGQLAAGRGASQADQYKAAVARNNAEIAENNAKYSEQQGQAKEDLVREKTAQTIGVQRAAMGANNIDAGSGSAVRVQADSARLGEIDALTVRNNAARTAYNWRLQGANYTQEAYLEGIQSAADKKAGYLNYWATGLGGAPTAANQYASLNQSPTNTPTTTNTSGGNATSGYSSTWSGWDNGGETGGATFSGDTMMT